MQISTRSCYVVLTQSFACGHFIIAESRLNVFSISIATTYRVPMTPRPVLGDETQATFMARRHSLKLLKCINAASSLWA